MRWLIWVLVWGLVAGCSATPVNSRAYTTAQTGMDEENIARSLQLELEVQKLKPALQDVQSWVQTSGGFVQSQSYVSDTQARIVCSIPTAHRDGFTTQIKTLGSLKDEALQAEDLSNEMTNLDAELKNLYKLRNRLKALVERADKVEDILAIERELNRVQARIDYLEKTERQQQKRVQYTSYVVTLNEKQTQVLGPLGWVVYGTWWTVKKLFIIQ